MQPALAPSITSSQPVLGNRSIFSLVFFFAEDEIYQRSHDLFKRPKSKSISGERGKEGGGDGGEEEREKNRETERESL